MSNRISLSRVTSQIHLPKLPVRLWRAKADQWIVKTWTHDYHAFSYGVPSIVSGAHSMLPELECRNILRWICLLPRQSTSVQSGRIWTLNGWATVLNSTMQVSSSAIVHEQLSSQKYCSRCITHQKNLEWSAAEWNRCADCTAACKISPANALSFRITVLPLGIKI